MSEKQDPDTPPYKCPHEGADIVGSRWHRPLLAYVKAAMIFWVQDEVGEWVPYAHYKQLKKAKRDLFLGILAKHGIPEGSSASHIMKFGDAWMEIIKMFCNGNGEARDKMIRSADHWRIIEVINGWANHASSSKSRTRKASGEAGGQPASKKKTAAGSEF